MKKIFTYTLCLGLMSLYLLLISSCTKDSGPHVLSDPNDSLSLSNDIQPIFTQNCVRCHGGFAPQSNMNLEDGKSYNSIVNVSAFSYSGIRVKPFSADSSVLWNKDAGTGVYGQQMPPGGPYLQAFEIDYIKKWINQGAKNN